MPTLYEERTVIVGAADTVLAPSNPRRSSIIIGSPKVATVWVSVTGPAAVGHGMALRPGTAPFVILRPDMDSLMVGEFRAVSEGAPEAIGVWDFFG